MVKNYFLLFFLTLTNFLTAQIIIGGGGGTPVPLPLDNPLVVFEYDDAGNQTYRGPQIRRNCPTCRDQIQQSSISLADQIANKIQAAPVPVKTDLTVIWDLSIKDYIVKIDLLPYNSFSIVASVNIRSLTDNSYVFGMGGFAYGVYYLKFYLSDGSVYTRTITKN